MSLKATKSPARYIVPLCLIFVVAGLTGYLYRGKPCAQSITRDFTREVDLAQNESYWVSYNITESPILESQKLRISYTVESDRTVDFYVMSESQYLAWKNGSGAFGISEEKARNSDDSFFVPPAYGQYYLILDNTPYNVSVSVVFRSTWIAIANLVDYSESFTWLVLAAISSVVAVAANILSGNPIGVSLRKLLEYSCRKRATEIFQIENLNVRTNITLKLFWIVVGLLFGLLVILLMRNFFINISYFQSLPELVPMSTDVMTRMFLYYAFAIVFMSIFFLFWQWLYSLLDDLQRWYLVDKKNLHWNSELNIASYHIMKRNLLSVGSVVFFSLAGVFFVSGSLVSDLRYPLLAIGTLCVSIPVSRVTFSSFREACRIKKMRWRTELKRSRPFTVNSVVIAILVIPMFLSTLSLLFPVVFDILDAVVINSFAGPQFKAFFYKELDPRKQLSMTLGLLTGNAVLFGSILFLLIILTTEYVMPQIAKELTRKRKLKLLSTPAIALVMTFVVCEAYTQFIETAYAAEEEWSLLIAVVAFGVTYLAGMSYEEAMK